jgi:hypothetical protein
MRADEVETGWEVLIEPLPEHAAPTGVCGDRVSQRDDAHGLEPERAARHSGAGRGITGRSRRTFGGCRGASATEPGGCGSGELWIDCRRLRRGGVRVRG